MLGDLFRAVGEVIGTIGGVAFGTIAAALNITTDMVKEAVDAGCKTTEEVKAFWEDR